MRSLPWAGTAAVSAVLLHAILRSALGEPYPGATLLLLLACGLAVVPLLPASLRGLSVQVALLPALALAPFATVLTTISLVGIRLSETSVVVSVTTFVLLVSVLSATRGTTTSEPAPPAGRRELGALAVLAFVAVFALASSWDIAYPFQARGTDWGHYLLYADEVTAQGHLLIDDPLAGEDERVFADPPAVGAVYGSFLLLDGVSSWSLTIGIVVLSAVTVLSMYAAAAALWGIGAGLVAAGGFAVAPIRLEPMYWHGLGTTLAMVFVPLVVMSLGLLFRGERSRRLAVFLATGLVGVAASHSTSAIVVATLVLSAALVDLAVRLLRGRRAVGPAARGWWCGGVACPLLAAVSIACVVGAGVMVHLWLQGRALGRPVGPRFLGPDWLDRAALEHYYGVPFLVLGLVVLTLVLTSGRLRRDPALLAVASLGLSCLAVSQLWRVGVSFDYQRVVYYLGAAISLLVGAAFVRWKPHAIWIAAFVVVFVLVARGSVGLRLPERVLRSEPRDAAVSGLLRFRDELDRGVLPDTRRLVTDSCLHFAVPYLVRRPTLATFTERQVGFVDRLALARQAAAVLGGGPEGMALAARLGVGYAVADPDCANLEQTLDGTTIVANERLVILRLASR